MDIGIIHLVRTCAYQDDGGKIQSNQISEMLFFIFS